MNRFANINWSPNDYAASAGVAEAVGQELLSRLQWLILQPTLIVDAGCGTGDMSLALQARYPNAQVLAVDHSPAMVAYAGQRLGASCLCADVSELPVADHSVDLLFANLLLPWHDNLQALLQRWCRLLKPEGVLMFTAFGPDTLKEWLPASDADTVLAQRVDMHDYGDLLLHTGFVDPVLDVEHYTTTYQDPNKLRLELQHTGMIDVGGDDTMRMQPDHEGRWSLTYEVVFAHAFAPPVRNTLSASEEGMVKVPLSSVRAALKNR